MLGVTPPAPSLPLHLCVQTHTLHNAHNNDFLGFPGLQTRGRPASPVACVRASLAAGGAAAPPTHLPTYLPTFLPSAAPVCGSIRATLPVWDAGESGVDLNHRAPQCGARNPGEASKRVPPRPRTPSAGGSGTGASGGGRTKARDHQA